MLRRRCQPAARPHLTCGKERIMLYDLPAGPAVTVVGPDDTWWWAELGEDPAGRHALVIGDPTTPRDAVVIAGSLPDIGAYLHPFHTALTGTVQDAHARNTRTGGHAEQREREKLPAPHPPTAEPPPATDLVTLPHTGLLDVPGVRVFAARRTSGQPWQIQMWSDLLRRAEPPFTAASACLLTLAALQAGNGALADAAVRRALQTDPDDPLARLVAQAIARGIHPATITALLTD